MATPRTLTIMLSPVEGGTVVGEGSYPSGSSVTVVATAGVDYSFVNWLYVNGLEASKNPTYTFTIVSDTTLTAVFKYHDTALVFCSGCFYRRLRPDGVHIVCQRNPPIPVQGEVAGQYPSASWPLIQDDWWCGEWRSATDMLAKDKR